MKTRAKRASGDAASPSSAETETETSSRKPVLTVISHEGTRSGVRPKVHTRPRRVKEAMPNLEKTSVKEKQSELPHQPDVFSESADAEIVAAPERLETQSSGMRFDLRIALAIVALFVAVNLMLLLTVGGTPKRTETAALPPVVTQPIAATPADSGIIMHDREVHPVTLPPLAAAPIQVPVAAPAATQATPLVIVPIALPVLTPKPPVVVAAPKPVTAVKPVPKPVAVAHVQAPSPAPRPAPAQDLLSIINQN